MSIPLLRTKLYTPPLRSESVARPCLVERLNAGSRGKLTLISAPAGFGKTTLLSEWADQLGRVEPKARFAWLSLDEGELEVLELIAAGLTNSEIASRLFLSTHTIKVHASNIYGKLGVHSRTQAVARAKVLGILPAA
jgi:ATP/maltotriose-dependent transcriptional regulator MalT